MWKTVCKWIICVLLLAYVAAAFALGCRDNAERTCTGIDLRIVGNTIPDTVLRQGIKSQLDAYKGRIVGNRLGDINIQHLEDYLSQFSNFESVECSVDPDSRLRITVVPIRPEVRVFEDSGRSFYINRAGKRIKANAEFFIDVPVLLTSSATPAGLKAAMPVINYVNSDSELNSLIAAFKVDGPSDILLIPRIHGHVVNFGDSTRLREKKAALLTAYREILPVKGWNTYDTISVKFRRQIVATRRDKARDMHGLPEDDGIDLEEATLPDVADINTQNTEENG